MFRKKSNVSTASGPRASTGDRSDRVSQTSVGSAHSASQSEVPMGDSFWELQSYKRVTKRMEAGIDSIDVVQSMLKERAAVEASYARKLQEWADRWSKHYEKKAEFGTLGAGYQGMITQARQCANVHSTVSSNLVALADTELSKFKKEQYHKDFPMGWKEVKTAEKGFSKATKPYAKLYSSMVSSKKSYYTACNLSAKMQMAAHAANDGGNVNTEDAMKLRQKADKAAGDADAARAKYENAIAALNNDQPRYINDMTVEYNKCEYIENTRIEKVREVSIKAAQIMDVGENPEFREIFLNQIAKLESISAEEDAREYSRRCGLEMHMNWPAFEEWDAEKEGLKVAPSFSSQGPPSDYDSAGAGGLHTPAEAHTSHTSFNQSFDAGHAAHHGGGGYNDYPSGGGGRAVRALYSYDAQGDDELTFNEGDIINLIEEADASGWAKGEINGRVGMLPANYVE